MNKLGLYVQNTTDSNIRDRLQRVRPSVVLVHLDGGDLAAWIRTALPETFIIGRKHWDQGEQDRLLFSATGASLADLMLAQKGASACHAFMLFNENMSSPVDYGGTPAFIDRAKRLDALQVDFRRALQQRGYDAVAWNFGAGNWPTADHYKEHFPLTMAEYLYFGFHVYGWPRLVDPNPWWKSNLAETLRIVDGMPPGKVCIVTELAVTRKYADDKAPDTGWLSGDGAPDLDAYSLDMAEVHAELCKRANVLGACLFGGATLPDWQTFAVTTALIDRIAAFQPCATDHQPVAAPVRLNMPVNHTQPLTIVSQWFGENPEDYDGDGHEGVDLALASGTPVFAPCAGKVHPTMKSPVYGNYVRLQSSGTLETADGSRQVKGTWETVCAHLSRVDVKPGDEVKAGQKIGEVGNTGRSTGPHLHFSLRLPGQKGTDKFWGYSDPAEWLGLKRPVPATKNAQAIALLKQALALLEHA